MALIGEMQYLTIGGNTYSLPVGGGGTVTSIAVSNATNGGLSVSGSPISSSGTITIGHSNVLAAAQTTQAVYPIKIDKNGHISAYGNAVTIPTVNNATLTIQKNGTTVNSFTANASNNVTANITVPTKTSDLTNDSGFLTGITSSQVTTALGYTPYNSTNPNGYTSNTGTVTKVTAGTGLSIGTTAGGNFTTSGTINHTNSVTAQTTQAIYPIKIDAQGHISAYGNAVTIPTVPSNIVNTITTTAGTHTAISSKTGAVSFNVPTKTSHLTNDSGFITDVQVDGTSVVTGGIAEIDSSSLLYGVCDTNANTAAKTATINSSFELVEGATIAIKFTNANTVANPTLNINNTGAKAIKRYGTTNAGVLEHTSWSKGEVVPLLYDGTYWQIMYNMTQNNYVTQTYSTNNNNYNLALSSYTNATIGVSDLNHSTKIKGNPSTGRITTEDMTSQEVEDFVDGLDISGGGILDMFYPVGSIYQTVDDGFNPNIRWGGTWELIEEGRFLQATETSATGGNTVSAGLPNIGGHLDIRATDYNASNVAWADGVFIKSTTAGFQADGIHQQNGAVDVLRYNFDAHYYNPIYGNSTTVQPPSIKVYMWHRTA